MSADLKKENARLREELNRERRRNFNPLQKELNRERRRNCYQCTSFERRVKGFNTDHWRLFLSAYPTKKNPVYSGKKSEA